MFLVTPLSSDDNRGRLRLPRFFSTGDISMPRYRLRFLKGPNYTLHLEYDAVVEAESFEAALAPHTAWPITESYNHATATAWNPGTCMYYQELWEAALLPDEDGASSKHV